MSSYTYKKYLMLLLTVTLSQLIACLHLYVPIFIIKEKLIHVKFVEEMSHHDIALVLLNNLLYLYLDICIDKYFQFFSF